MAEVLRNWAAREGYKVVDEIIEAGYSRESWQRPGLDKIRDWAEAGFRGDVLAYKRDRLFSNPVYRGLFEMEMEPYGIRLRATDDIARPEDDLDDVSSAEIGDAVTDWVSRQERNNIARRTHDGRRERAHNGQYVWTGTPPYGYQYQDGKLVPDPKTEPNVRRIFEIVGNLGQGQHQVRKLFKEQGIPSPRGAAVWPLSTIRRIIDNPIYSDGVTYYGKTRTRTKHTLNGKVRVKRDTPDQAIAIQVQRLDIPIEWIEAARRNVANNVSWSPSDKRDWQLRGFAACPGCGRRLMTYYNSRGEAYYICASKRQLYDCPEAAYHRAEPLEQRVIWFLAEKYLFKPDELIKTLNRFIETERATDPGPQIAALTEQIKGLEDRRDRYVEAYAGGAIKNVDDLAAKTAAIDRQIESARSEIQGLQDRVGHIQRLEAAASDAETLAAIIQVRSNLDDEEMMRQFYGDLQLQVMPYRDGTVELSWIGGRTELQTPRRSPR